MDLSHVQPTTLLTAVIVILVVALGAFYLVGTQVGRRRARELIRQSIEMLRPIGHEDRFTWLGTTGCEIRLSELRPPFAGMRVVLWLEPREIFPLWLVNRLRGRRDVVGVAADLVKPPRTSFELVDPASAAGRRALAKCRERKWKEAPWTFAGRSLLVAADDLPEARRVLARLSAPPSVERLSLARLGVSDVSPQLSVTIGKPDALAADGAGFVEWLTRAAETVAEVPGAGRPPERTRPNKLPRSRRSGR